MVALVVGWSSRSSPKGFTYEAPDARALRLGNLRVTALDWVVCTTTALALVGMVAAGQTWPVFR